MKIYWIGKTGDVADIENWNPRFPRDGDDVIITKGSAMMMQNTELLKDVGLRSLSWEPLLDIKFTNDLR